MNMVFEHFLKLPMYSVSQKVCGTGLNGVTFGNKLYLLVCSTVLQTDLYSWICETTVTIFGSLVHFELVCGMQHMILNEYTYQGWQLT